MDLIRMKNNNTMTYLGTGKGRIQGTNKHLWMLGELT